MRSHLLLLRRLYSHMRCEDCPRFDAERESCKDNKLNPRTWENAVEAVQMFGPRSLCMMNDHRERIIDVFNGATLEGKAPRHSSPVRMRSVTDAFNRERHR